MTSKSSAEQVVKLKLRVTELESQVSDYKKRLDSLRKAKNTTIVKREREVLEVGAPNFGQRRDTGREEEPVSSEQLEALKHTQELKHAKKDQPECNHEGEIRRLQDAVETLEQMNAALTIENEDIRLQFESTLQQLSIREAEWCEKEEQLKLKAKQSNFGDRYAEWMAQTETKIQELEKTNALLRDALKAEQPR